MKQPPSQRPAANRDHASPVPWWVAPIFTLLAAATLPWVVYLALTLPYRATAVHYRAAWVGFDIFLVLLLAATAWHGWRGSPRIALSATATASLLLVDAWFDVLTTPYRAGRWVSVLLACCFELPLAALCLWLARHAERVVVRRLKTLARRADARDYRDQPGRPYP